MGWASKSNSSLVEAIISTFGDSPDDSFRRLSQFTQADWSRTEFWLDTSGLALYFLDIVQSTGLADAIDGQLLRKLELKREDNRVRVADMLQEFIAINKCFNEAGICYANLKGFTLTPDSCPNPLLRHQSDLDFLVDPGALNHSRALLEERGYILTGSTPRCLEFMSAGPARPSLEGQYKVSNRRSVELHIVLESPNSIGHKAKRDIRLNRLHDWESGGRSFPALSRADQLIGQALHILGHLRNEHTRPSWLLEYRHHVKLRRGDEYFWREVRTLADAERGAGIALGLSTVIATELFGPFSSPAFDSWTVDTLPREIKLWGKQYGRKAVLADVPGTKFYLFLEAALRETFPERPKSVGMRRLIPLRRPAPLMQAPPHETLAMRIRRERIEIQFILFRLRFHIKQGFLFVLEAYRWRRLKSTTIGLGGSFNYSPSKRTEFPRP
jgi:hypothetical protein